LIQFFSLSHALNSFPTRRSSDLMPDFDIDFCMEGRDRVIEYVAERYGRDRVSQIITYGTMAARAVVRDVGRVLGHPYSYVDRVRSEEHTSELQLRFDLVCRLLLV